MLKLSKILANQGGRLFAESKPFKVLANQEVASAFAELFKILVNQGAGRLFAESNPFKKQSLNLEKRSSQNLAGVSF